MRSSHYIGASKSPAQMAMRIEFSAQIMKQSWNCRFFSCSSRTFGAQINWRVISRNVLLDPHRFLPNLSTFRFAMKSGNRITFFNGKRNVQNENGIDRHGPRLMPNNCQHLDPPISRYQLPLNNTQRSSPLWPFLLLFSAEPGAA